MGVVAFCFHLKQLIDQGAIRPISAFSFERYDETPTKIDVNDSTLSKKSTSHKGSKTQTVKVLQSEAAVASMVHDWEI